MNRKPITTFNLSQEELFVLLSYLQVKELLGVDIGVLAKLSKDQAKLVLEVAERALIARGFLVPGGDNRFKLADVVHVVLQACFNPDRTIWINCRYPEKVEEVYYLHITRNISVLRAMPMTAVHQFLVLVNKESLAKSAFSILNLGESPSLACPAGQISETAFDKVHEQIEASTEEQLARELIAGSIDPHTAAYLAITLKKPILHHTVVHIQRQSGAETQIDGFSLLKGENGLWMLKPVEVGSTSDKFVAITPVTTEEVGKMLKTIFLSSEATPNG